MKLYGFIVFLLFAVCSWCCSLPPGVPDYSITDRAVLAPVVVHGLVLNISTTTRINVYYKACVKVLEVIKGDPNLPRELCFGDFGGDYLCLSHVYENNTYVFFMNADLSARYDGIPVSAFLANGRTVDSARQGYCNPLKPNPFRICERPSINREILKSSIRVREGQTAMMSCYGTGTVPLLVNWKKVGSKGYAAPATSNRYLINQVTVSDMGVYQCTIQNPAGKTTELVRLFVDPIPCGAFIYLGPGQQSVIESPNYPQPYMHDKMCSWRICPSQGRRIKLDFKSFDLSRSFGDNVQIYHECDAVRSGATKYCSTTSPGRLVSKCTSHCIQIWFQSAPRRGFKSSKGFFATATSTDEGTMTYDYNKLYCESEIILRFLPKVKSFRRMTGRVLQNYKTKGPKPGQDITIQMTSLSTDLFGCFADVRPGSEYYVGVVISSRGTYTLKFALLSDAPNKPRLFDVHLNKFKTEKQKCSPTRS